MVAKSFWDLQYNFLIRKLITGIPISIAARFTAPASHFSRLSCTNKDAVKVFKKLRATEEKLDHEVLFYKMLNVNDEEVLAEGIDILVAGSDATATTLAVALEQFITSPEYFDKLQREVDDIGLETE